MSNKRSSDFEAAEGFYCSNYLDDIADLSLFCVDIESESIRSPIRSRISRSMDCTLHCNVRSCLAKVSVGAGDRSFREAIDVALRVACEKDGCGEMDGLGNN